MAVYKLFPSKDTFLSTQYPDSNNGLDEILEVGNYQVNGVTNVARPIVEFSNTEIVDIVDNTIGGTNFSASLNMTIATAYETPVSYTINAYPVFTTWDNGVGKFGDLPTNKTGASWNKPLNDGSGSWEISPGAGVTGSYSGSTAAGGIWYTGSNGVNLEASQSFTLDLQPDLDINVTAATKEFYNGNITNKGFILKFEDALEFNTTKNIRHKFFSKDTNTIYPPTLDIKWDDSSYVTASLSVLNTDQSFISFKNNKGEYVNEGKQRFRLTARPKYPTRTFTTGSIYNTNYALPSASYWGLKDEFTEEMVIDFDTNFTKISCDSNGPFMDIYMKGLQPERFYRILIKSTLDGSTTVIDDESIFKVVRNG